ncbi:hypothetical protein SAMN05445060_3081 [Williamsia sterculiae]|uniref:Uncharacterized protein n=1 Tax=Williamsia sterculiae TaxID=1344003 RepID=A0A1N7GSU3_9NOCA|nr:hypothetical protein SAMN05445060_3081 [Williamsia sterculiae]
MTEPTGLAPRVAGRALRPGDVLAGLRLTCSRLTGLGCARTWVPRLRRERRLPVRRASGLGCTLVRRTLRLTLLRSALLWCALEWAVLLGLAGRGLRRPVLRGLARGRATERWACLRAGRGGGLFPRSLHRGRRVGSLLVTCRRTCRSILFARCQGCERWFRRLGPWPPGLTRPRGPAVSTPPGRRLAVVGTLRRFGGRRGSRGKHVRAGFTTVGTAPRLVVRRGPTDLVLMVLLGPRLGVARRVVATVGRAVLQPRRSRGQAVVVVAHRRIPCWK